jgi:vacuolar protein sorting-associated protein 35
LTHKEVIRLQTALLQFSIKCFPGNMEQVSQCINSCVSALRQASAFHEVMPEGAPRPQSTKVFDDASIVELEKLLSIPLDSLALRVLELEQYSHLIGFLPWANRRGVAITMLKAVENTGPLPMSVADIEQLFKAIEPLVRDEVLGSGMVVGNANGQLTYQQTQHGMVQGLKTMQQSFDPVQLKRIQEENSHVSKLIHSLDHKHTDVVFEMLLAARNHMSYEGCNPNRVGNTLVALIFRAIKLALLVFNAEQGSPAPASTSNEKTTELASKQPTSPDEVTEGEEVAAQTPATEINSIEASKALSFDVRCVGLGVLV